MENKVIRGMVGGLALLTLGYAAYSLGKKDQPQFSQDFHFGYSPIQAGRVTSNNEVLLMTADQYLAGDPKSSPSGTILDRDYIRHAHKFKHQVREEFGEKFPLTDGELEYMVKRGKYAERSLEVADLEKNLREVIRLKKPVQFTPEVEKRLRKIIPSYFNFVPIVNGDKLVELRTWLVWCGASGPLTSEHYFGSSDVDLTLDLWPILRKFETPWFVK